MASKLKYQKCSVHQTAHDKLLGPLDHHHVIPVMWQAHWHGPPEPLFPGHDSPRGVALWDDRTVVLAPTCHRNVHFWIVELMRAYSDLGLDGATIDGAKSAVVKRYGAGAAQVAEMPVALLALERFAGEGGGDLHALIALDEWGQS